MNGKEATALARYARAAKPQQKWDDFTPDVWADVLEDLRYDDARAAIKHLARSAAYVDVESIRETVKRIRDDRIERNAERMPEFPGDPDDARGWLTWHRAMLAAIADGQDPKQAADSDLVRRALPDLRRMLPSPPPGEKDTRPLSERMVPFKFPPRPERELEQQQSERLEAERQRQLRALEAIATVTQPQQDAGDEPR